MGYKGQQKGGDKLVIADRPVDVYETYNRSLTGPKISESDWDNKVIPENAKKLKEKIS